MTDNISEKDKKDWEKFISNKEKLPNKDNKPFTKSPLKIRSIKPGDRFHPLGMNGHRKLQDILTDQKIPKRNRSAIPVVTCNDSIVWVPGFRIASGWEVPKKQADSVHLRIIYNET